MTFIDVVHPLQVASVGEPTRDRFNNLVPGEPGPWREVLVASWWVSRTEEKHGESIMRTIDYLHVHLRPEDAPGPGGRLRLPDGTVWEVQGNPENYEHGFHGWAPGLVVVNATRTEG